MNLRVNKNACIGCGACDDGCPAGAIFMDGFAEIDTDACIECNICVGLCPVKAITDDEYSKPQEVLDLGNAEIEQKIRQYRLTLSASAYGTILAELQDANVLCPGKEENGRFYHSVIKEPNGKTYFMVFTSKEHMKERSASFKAIRFTDAAKLAVDAVNDGVQAEAVVLNPHTDRMVIAIAHCEQIVALENERRETGVKKTSEFKTPALGGTNNEDVDSLITKAAKEKDPKLLDQILSLLYTRDVRIKIQRRENGKDSISFLNKNGATNQLAVQAFIGSDLYCCEAGMALGGLPFRSFVEMFMSFPEEVAELILAGSQSQLVLPREAVKRLNENYKSRSNQHN